MEKEMATHSSILAWRIPGTEEPGGLLSMGSHRVRHDWSNLAVAAWVYQGLPRWCSDKESANAEDTRDMGRVWALGREDPLEKEMAIYSSVLAWEIPWTEWLWWPTDHGLTKCWKWLSDWAHTHGNISKVSNLFLMQNPQDVPEIPLAITEQ